MSHFVTVRFLINDAQVAFSACIGAFEHRSAANSWANKIRSLLEKFLTGCQLETNVYPDHTTALRADPDAEFLVRADPQMMFTYLAEKSFGV